MSSIIDIRNAAREMALEGASVQEIVLVLDCHVGTAVEAVKWAEANRAGRRGER